MKKRRPYRAKHTRASKRATLHRGNRQRKKKADWKQTPEYRLRKSLEPKLQSKLPDRLPSPYHDGLSAGYTTALIAHIRDGKPHWQELLEWLSPVFEKQIITSPEPTKMLLGLPLVATASPTVVEQDVTNDKYRAALVGVLFKKVPHYGYDDLRGFARGFSEAVASTPPGHTQTALINFVYMKHRQEIERLIAKDEKLEAIAAFINKRLPKPLTVSVEAVKKVVQRQDLPRRRITGRPRRKRGHG